MIDQLRGILLLCALYIPAAYGAAWFDVGVPGAVAGLVLCLLAMLAIRPLQRLIRPGANVVLALVPLFLVPLLARMAMTIDFTSLRTWGVVLLIALCAVVSIVFCALSVKVILRGEDEL